MKALTRVIPLVLVGLVAALVLTAAGGGKKAVTIPAGDLKWVENPANKAISSATLWGDPAKGAYGVMRKAAAGTDLGWHTHSADEKVVAISGTFDFQMAGGEPTVLTPGSYAFIPAKAVHTAKCRPDADCIFFEEGPAKTDFKPAKAPTM
jgi:quercetin dioxygenase-like cupin family protein